MNEMSRDDLPKPPEGKIPDGKLQTAGFSPREIVSELDRYIVGQNEAKRAVAIALRNRWRRQQLPEGLREEVQPKNILMIGPTGVGKTEIARRLARLAQAPFLKVEATKFTEVGYVGRDVEQIIRDLVEIALSMTREKLRKDVAAKAEIAAEERVLDALVGESATAETRSKFRRKLRAGELDSSEIEVKLRDQAGGMPTFEIPGMPGASMGMVNLNDVLGKAFGGGMPISALAGRRAVMRHLRPVGQSELSGTYLAHLTAVLAAQAALETYREPGFYERLAATGERFYGGFREIVERAGVPLRIQHVGPRFGMYFGISEEVTNYRQAAQQDKAMLQRFVAGCIARGVYFHMAAHHGFSAAHDDRAIDRALAGIEGVIEDIRQSM